MTSPPTGAQWADRWLADAALRRGLPGCEKLPDLASAATAWEALVRAGASPDAVLELACLVSATRPADLTRVGPADSMLLPQAVARRFGVVPVRTDGPTIVVAASNPLDSALERDLGFASGRRITLLTASPGDIARAQERVYGAEPEQEHASTGGGATTVVPRRPSLTMAAIAPRPLAEDPETMRSHAATLVDGLLDDALREAASDLHFEPKEDGLLVRFRVDGSLYDARRIPSEQGAQVIRRLKVLGDLDISDSMRPQDGRATLHREGRAVDLRVSSLPLGRVGEKVVVRILDSRVAARDLDAVGFSTRELLRIKRLLELPEGLILVTGPTGSGKTSTLYAGVRHVQRDHLNIVTVEDPIEHRIEGINQVQVNERARVTFASSLRSILRQDPDVVLVGEMRDTETASIAMKASMTGHLVLSTLHANDALSTVERLYDMQIDTSVLSAALKGIVGQRLVRRLCDACARVITLDALPAHQQLLLSGRATQRLRQPVGCAACRGTGYHGRTVVAEILLVTPAVQRAIARRAAVTELTDLARECGMHSMWESGLERVLDGTTSLHELLDNVAAPFTEADPAAAQADVDALLAELLQQPPPVAPPKREPLPELPDVVPPSDAELPRSIGVRVAESPVEPPRPPAPARATPPRPPTALRVLLVEEIATERRRLAAALAAEGLSVLEAADGDAALAMIRRLRPDVVVTDVAMPRLDASMLLHAVHAEQLGARVVIYTSQSDEALEAWMRELGAEDVIPRTLGARMLAGRLRLQVSSVA